MKRLSTNYILGSVLSASDALSLFTQKVLLVLYLFFSFFFFANGETEAEKSWATADRKWQNCDFIPGHRLWSLGDEIWTYYQNEPTETWLNCMYEDTSLLVDLETPVSLEGGSFTLGQCGVLSFSLMFIFGRLQGEAVSLRLLASRFPRRDGRTGLRCGGNLPAPSGWVPSFSRLT